MLELSRLRALHAVHQHGTVSAAATALGYTASAVSQQIAKLERETRSTLLERRGRGVALTEAAQVLVATAAGVLALVERAEVELERQRGRPGGTLSIAAFATAARGLLPGALAQLLADHPEVVPRLVEADPHISVDLVARGEIDLAVVHDWDVIPLPAPAGLDRLLLGEDPCDMLLPARHPLAGAEFVTREQVAGERWICQPPGTICHDWLARTMRECGHELEPAFEVAEYATQAQLVAAGLGVALVPRLGRELPPPGAVVVPLEPVPVRRLYALWRSDASRRPTITEAVRRLTDGWRRSGGAERV
ncbi:LysR family transcriptional regulator [Streptomyces otsuchiensis]|uniref:LysR family transcriptional regulator n=1 Tax=Streptomyces otsuchiensis TaxID=2681388 RepID=UPI0010300579|nr:LysR family transcriptional regulator [Streptomyces otsuchiensis]